MNSTPRPASTAHCVPQSAQPVEGSDRQPQVEAAGCRVHLASLVTDSAGVPDASGGQGLRTQVTTFAPPLGGCSASLSTPPVADGKGGQPSSSIGEVPAFHYAARPYVRLTHVRIVVEVHGAFDYRDRHEWICNGCTDAFGPEDAEGVFDVAPDAADNTDSRCLICRARDGQMSEPNEQWWRAEVLRKALERSFGDDQDEKDADEWSMARGAA
jgi:hypothetical protein